MRRVTISRLLVLLLNLSLLLALPAARSDAQPAFLIEAAGAEKPGSPRAPVDPQIVDSLLVTATPELPVLGGIADNDGGAADLALPAELAMESLRPEMPQQKAPVSVGAWASRAHPWSTGPPTA